ncbi:EsaB/YukD family protein, partial [Streptomyces sp. NPDC000931]
MSGYCRVTITGPQNWADLALPGSVPVAALMPRIIEVCVPEDEPSDPASWSLTTVDGNPVRSDEPLEGAGVYDGDVL